MEVEREPIKKNSFLGTFTHCGNVLDLCAVAVPAGMYQTPGPHGAVLPFSVTMLAGDGCDADVLGWGEELEAAQQGREGGRAKL